MPKSGKPSVAVNRTLRELGQNLKTARLRRRLQAATVAERAFISRQTLTKVEKGDPGVAMGIYASVMLALGSLDQLKDVAAPALDAVGLQLEEQQLPKRVRYKRTRSAP